MQAAYLENFGAAEQIQVGELTQPKLSAGEVLMKVLATPVNHVDTFVASGSFKTAVNFPLVLGRDAVGEVVAVSATSQFHIGDLVWTNSMGYEGRSGVASELAAIPEARLFSVPTGVNPLQLIASVHSSATASILLKLLGVKTGEQILIEGAAGHVGTKLVQIANFLGLQVMTASAPKDFEQLKKLEAKQTFDYHEAYFEQLQGQVDYVIDTSGKVALADNLAVLANHGKVGLITAPEDNQFTFSVREFYTSSKQILGFVISRASLTEIQTAGQQLNQLFAQGLLLDDELLTVPLKKASWAYQAVITNSQHRQRILLQPNE